MKRTLTRPLTLLLTLLGACGVVPIVKPNPPGSELSFAICEAALERPADGRAYQGLDGWFFFKYDLEESYPLLEQTDFITDLSRTLATQGVSLVVLPIPSRAVVKPEALYPDDPLQAAFSPPEAARAYATFLRALRDGGVEVVDVLGASRAHDAQGGQTFFKRDLHWTTEGADAVAQEAAETVRRAAGGALPDANLALARSPVDDRHHGQYVSRWLYAYCGYVLPPEPLGVYTVSRPDGGGDLFGGSAPEVVLAGSSFSLPPFYYEFLAVALQTEVLSTSVGAGGAQQGLESYLLDGAYEADRPSVLVWEFPVFAPPLSEAAQRQLLASVYGACSAEEAVAAGTLPEGKGRLELAGTGLAEVAAAKHYLALSFEDLSLLRFGVVLRYRGGFEEVIAVDRSALTLNRGRYFLTLADDPQAVLEGIRLELPETTGQIEVQLCPIPR